MSNDSTRFCALTSIAILAFTGTLSAQEGTWSVTASAGYGKFNFEEVDDDNRSDVEGWNRIGLAVEQFESLTTSPVFSGSAAYRFSREFNVSLSGRFFSKAVTASFNGTQEILLLKRSVSSTDLSLGMAYYPPAQLAFIQWSAGVSIGYMFARAGAEAFGTRSEKVGTDLTTTTTIDTKADFRKSKIVVAASLGAEASLFKGLLFTIEGCYRFAPLGKLDGDVTRFGATRSETTSIEFDYSGFVLSAGLGVEF